MTSMADSDKNAHALRQDAARRTRRDDQLPRLAAAFRTTLRRRDLVVDLITLSPLAVVAIVILHAVLHGVA